MTWMLTALIGASLGYALVQVLFIRCFYPKSPVRLANLQWQGWVPRWLDTQLASTAERLIISIQLGRLIQERLLDGKTRQAADQWITQKVGDYLTHTLPVKWPMISMLIGEKTHDKVKQALSDYLQENWDNQIQSLGEQHLSETALRQYVKQFVQSVDTSKWKDQFEVAAQNWKRRILLIAMPLGALLAILGKLIYQALISG